VYAQDEYGRPFIIVREQGARQRLKGLEAQKVSCIWWLLKRVEIRKYVLSIIFLKNRFKLPTKMVSMSFIFVVGSYPCC
jgi:hypothetical protein